jgi:GNAT superfamily N-acetyltransferase
MLEIRRVDGPADLVDAAALLHDHVEWIRTAAGFDPLAAQPALADELAHLREHYAAPGRELWLADRDGLAVGTVAVHVHDDRSAELKRMYVRPIARGQGVADALVRRAISRAREHGCRSVWLETVRGAMDRAIAVYRRHGFRPVDPARQTLRLDSTVVVMERPLLAGESVLAERAKTASCSPTA